MSSSGAPRRSRTLPRPLVRRRLLALVGIGLAALAAAALPPLLQPPPGEALIAAPTGSHTRTSTTPPAAPSGRSVAPASVAPVTGGTRATRVTIPALSIDLPIVDGDGIDAPIDKAAHYPGSAWPGAGSNIYLYGHAQEGMFINLWQAEPGQVIELELADGSKRAYVVTEVRERVAWDDLSVLAPTPHEQLTLQTSTSYIPTAPRFVVIAEPRR